MFNSTSATDRGQASRSTILETALQLFRNQGLDQTKMRDIAQQAGVALGAAYYYFPSKDAIVQAYYDSVQTQHEQRVQAALAAGKLKLRDRLAIVFHTKLDILKDDRNLLGTIFRHAGDPDHPLSVLGPATRSNRQRSIAVFALAFAAESLPSDLQEFLPIAFWALHMGVLMFFIYDRSPEQSRTKKVVERSVDLAVSLLKVAKSPLLKPFRNQLLSLLREVELVPLDDVPLNPESVQESI